jgi:hypothetical protein
VGQWASHFFLNLPDEAKSKKAGGRGDEECIRTVLMVLVSTFLAVARVTVTLFCTYYDSTAFRPSQPNDSRHDGVLLS